MKLQKYFLILIFLFVSFQICFGQEKQPDLKLYASLVEPNCEYLLAHLDGFFIETFKNPDNFGYIVIQGGANPIKVKFFETAIRNYIRFRGVNQDHLTIFTSNSGGELKINFYISKDEKVKPNISIFSYKLSTDDKSILFTRFSVEIAKIDNRLTFIADCGCCIEYVNLSLLSEFLKANPNLNASIKIYNKTRKRAKQLENLIKTEATYEYKIQITRLKFNYGGIDGSIKQMPNSFSTVEINLVPAK